MSGLLEGKVAIVASTAGLQGVKGMAGYVAGKHAIVGLTKAAALDYAHRNICCQRGRARPDPNRRLETIADETRRAIGSHVPLGRIGASGEVAATVVWLLSDQTGYLTRATVPVDGGGLAGAS